MNPAVFKQILISDDGEFAGELPPPFQLLLEETGTTEDGFILY
jgi:hypothetical protein